MHNATELERLGTPAVAFATTPFAKTAENMAKRRGFPGYRYILVEHPLSSAGDEGIRERARIALPRVLSIALGLDEEPPK